MAGVKKVYFVRHGESQWNVEDKICGITDSPLTEKGRRQAVETGRAILDSGIQADLILHSPLMRASETARLISGITGLPLRAEQRIVEQAFGRWEGTSPRNSEEFYRAKLNFIDSFGTGESMFRVAQRIYNLLDEIRADDQTYILVAHNGIARFVKSYFQDMTNEEFAGFGIRNAEVCEFEF